MAELEQDLLSALQSLESAPEKPCGCHDKAISSAFRRPSVSNRCCTGESRSAIGRCSCSDFSGKGRLEFGEPLQLKKTSSSGVRCAREGPQLDLNDIIRRRAERYPGLKIDLLGLN